MATNKESLNALRAEAKKRERAVGQKASRLKAQGVLITGTQYDPRIGAARINKLNERQLRAHLGRVNQFQSRSTQFEGLAEGVPITRTRANQFAETQQRYNEYVAKYRDAFKDIPVQPKAETARKKFGKPKPPPTVEELDKRVAGSFGAFAKGRSALKPLYTNESEFEGITSPESLDKIEQNMINRMNPDYLSGKIAEGRRQADKMLEVVGGESELQKLVAGLTDFQFNVLWHEMDLAASLASAYWLVANASVREHAHMQEEAMNEFGVLIKWGQGIEPQA